MRTMVMVVAMALFGCEGGELQEQEEYDFIPVDRMGTVDEEAAAQATWERQQVDAVESDLCPENDEDTENSYYTGAWCGFVGGGKSHGCCNGAQCVGAPSGSGSFPGRCCYCIMPNGNCGSYSNCVNQTPKWDCVLGSTAVRLSPFCQTCGSPYGHNAGPDSVCQTADDTY